MEKEIWMGILIFWINRLAFNPITLEYEKSQKGDALKR